MLRKIHPSPIVELVVLVGGVVCLWFNQVNLGIGLLILALFIALSVAVMNGGLPHPHHG